MTTTGDPTTLMELFEQVLAEHPKWPQDKLLKEFRERAVQDDSLVEEALRFMFDRDFDAAVEGSKNLRPKADAETEALLDSIITNRTR